MLNLIAAQKSGKKKKTVDKAPVQVPEKQQPKPAPTKQSVTPIPTKQPVAPISTAPAKAGPVTTPAVVPAPAPAAKADESEAQSKSKKKKKKGTDKADVLPSDATTQAVAKAPPAAQLSFREQIQFPPIPANVPVPEPKIPPKAAVKIELDRE